MLTLRPRENWAKDSHPRSRSRRHRWKRDFIRLPVEAMALSAGNPVAGFPCRLSRCHPARSVDLHGACHSQWNDPGRKRNRISRYPRCSRGGANRIAEDSCKFGIGHGCIGRAAEDTARHGGEVCCRVPDSDPLSSVERLLPEERVTGLGQWTADKATSGIRVGVLP